MVEIATAPAMLAFASPSLSPVLLSFPSFVTLMTFVTVAHAPTLTTSVAIPVWANRSLSVTSSAS